MEILGLIKSQFNSWKYYSRRDWGDKYILCGWNVKIPFIITNASVFMTFLIIIYFKIKLKKKKKN